MVRISKLFFKSEVLQSAISFKYVPEEMSVIFSQTPIKNEVRSSSQSRSSV